MKKRIAMLAVLAVLGSAIAYKKVRGKTKQDPNTVRVSGNIEVTDAEISFKIAGRVLHRLVDEGQMVRTSQVVAILDSTELAQEVSVQRADMNAAQADLAELLAGSRPEEIEQGRASVQLAQAEADRALADYRRAEQLYGDGIASSRDYEVARTSYEVSRSKVQDAAQRLILLDKGPRQEKVEQARARLEKARQSLSVTETRLGYTTLFSPITGVVLSKNVEPGEFVAAGTPVVTIGDLQNVWLRSYINETDLGRVKVGQPVCVTSDTYPGRRYAGQISFISSEAEFTPKNVQTEKERVKLVYRIKVDIQNPTMELKPGMPADADIYTVGGGPCRPSGQKASANNSAS